MVLNLDGNLEDKFGKAEIILGPMASAKSSLALLVTAIFRQFANDLNCKVDLFRPDVDTREQMSRMGIEKDKDVTRISKSEEIIKYVKEKEKFAKRRVIFIDEVEFLDSEIINAVLELTKKGHYLLMSGLATNFRGEPFAFSDYKSTMEDLLRIIPEQNRGTSRWAKCKTCRKTAEYTQRLINDAPAPYYDPLIRVDSEKDKEKSEKKYSYEPRCKEHFYVPGKEEYKFVAFILKQNQGLKLNEAISMAEQNGKIAPDITKQIVATMCAEKQAYYDGQKIYAPPIIEIATQMPWKIFSNVLKKSCLLADWEVQM